MTIGFFLLSAACTLIPPRDGAVDERRELDAPVDTFESAEPAFSFGSRGAFGKGFRAHVRDGIQLEGTRSLLVEMPPEPEHEGDYESHIHWRFDKPRDFSEMDGFTISFYLMGPTKRIRIVMIEPDGTFYWTKLRLDTSRLNEWQTVVVPTEFVWSHEGAASRPGVRHSDLKNIAAIDIRFMTDPKLDVAFGVDAVGFVRKRDSYAGPVLRIDGTERVSYLNKRDETVSGLNYVNWVVDRPFHFEARMVGGTADRDYDVDFWSLGWENGTTNYLGSAKIAKGATSFSQEIDIAAQGPGYRRCVAVLSSGGVPVWRTSRSYTMMRGLRPEDAGPNPTSVFGNWTGPGEVAQKLGVKRWRSFLWSTKVEFDAEHRPVGGRLSLPNMMDFDTTFCFVYTPQWLTSKPEASDWRKYPPKDYQLYEDYVAAVTAANLTNGYHRYELWNEPVPYANWRGTVADLVPLVRATCRGVKRVQPDAEIVGPSGYSFLPEFLEEFFRQGGTNWIDGVSIHTYTPTPPDEHFVKGLKGTRALMKKYGVADKPLYITEMGYATPAVCEEDIAAFMVRCYLYAWENGVKFVIWHDVRCWKDYPPDYEMMSWDLTPRAHFTAYGVMTRELEGARLVRRLEMPQVEQVGFLFERRGVRTHILWNSKTARGASAGVPYRLRLADGECAMLVTLDGRESQLLPDTDGFVSVGVGRDPVYLRIGTGEEVVR